jgi:hypothetical protein
VNALAVTTVDALAVTTVDALAVTTVDALAVTAMNAQQIASVDALAVTTVNALAVTTMDAAERSIAKNKAAAANCEKNQFGRREPGFPRRLFCIAHFSISPTSRKLKG